MEAIGFFRCAPRLALFMPPYRKFVTINSEWQPPTKPPRGCFIVWWLVSAVDQKDEFEWLFNRAPGISLIVVLPSAEDIHKTVPLIQYLDAINPRGVLPHGRIVSAHRIKSLIAAPPASLSLAAVEYLARRGILVDSALRQDVRRIFELAPEVRSVSQLARRLYVSRRTLGRRFESVGLPVPSHWLQFARLLHIAIRLQCESTAMFRIATRFGYPDGFTMSNQMHRLVGCRPTEVRRLLGWEWVIEAWLRREATQGGIDLTLLR
jgi:AraC-like DNA-binding protein